MIDARMEFVYGVQPTVSVSIIGGVVSGAVIHNGIIARVEQKRTD